MSSIVARQHPKSDFEMTPDTTDHVSEPQNDIDCPEGGVRAWLVVLGAWCAMIPSMGMLNTIGVIDAWIGENQLSSLPKSQTAWVVSIYAFLLYVGGSFAGAIFDRYGIRPLIITGSIGMAASIMCLSVSTEYFHFLLSFGVLGGMSACCLFTPSVSTIGHWFCKRRGLATGIACTAGGMGGLMFSLIILYLAPVIGFGWTMRIIGFICLGTCVIACLTLETRNTRRRQTTLEKEPGLLDCLRRAFDLKALAYDMSYLSTTIAVFLIEFAVFIPITYISSAAIGTGQGIDPERAYRMIALLNAGSIPGRALPGHAADHFGRFNIMILTALVCTILILCIWLPPTVLAVASEPALTSFAVLFGFWCGAAISLTPVVIGQISKVEMIGRKVGTTFSISSLAALVGVPIGGAIIDADGGGYTSLVIFSGGLYVLATAGFVVARFVSGPRRLVAIY